MQIHVGFLCFFVSTCWLAGWMAGWLDGWLVADGGSITRGSGQEILLIPELYTQTRERER